MITVSFLAVMLLYGAIVGFSKIPGVLWFFLFPFSVADVLFAGVSTRVHELYQRLIFRRL